jgi:hypothetical protein
MNDREERVLNVARRRMDELADAIRARDWQWTEHAFDKVNSKLAVLDGTRSRPYDPPSP